MTITVAIPAFNAQATIEKTLDSVFRQTVRPHEILVLNDGSTDGTADLLQSIKPRITVLSQPNAGLAKARNVLISHSQGDLVAFLDSDDIWHPQYLELMGKLYGEHPDAVAFFSGLVNFEGFGDYQWNTRYASRDVRKEVLRPLDFFTRYNKGSGHFVADCCIPRKVLNNLGDQPYREMGAEDSYCFSLLALTGPVVQVSVPLIARRIHESSLSANHLWTFGVWVHVFELLADRYKNTAGPELLMAFRLAFAAKRRSYAKLLMGAQRVREAREELWRSLSNSQNPFSIAKSLRLLLMSYLPKRLQPHWPPSHRKWRNGEGGENSASAV